MKGCITKGHVVALQSRDCTLTAWPIFSKDESFTWTEGCQESSEKIILISGKRGSIKTLIYMVLFHIVSQLWVALIKSNIPLAFYSFQFRNVHTSAFHCILSRNETNFYSITTLY